VQAEGWLPVSCGCMGGHDHTALSIGPVAGLAQDEEPGQPGHGETPRGPLATMDEIEAFLDECHADPWFQSHPEVAGSKAC
jgi:hypothetical protein